MTTTHSAADTARALDEGGIEALAGEIGGAIAGEVQFDRASRLLYATDASIYQMEPACIVFPRHAGDVAAVMRICAGRGIAVLPRGAGTSLAGQAVNHAVVLDFSRYMAAILEINAEQSWARVQPGVVLAALNQAAAGYDLQYPIDPATQNRATIGGGIGNNSCGAHSVLYGKTVDHVLSLDVVLADGTAATLRPLEGAALSTKLDLPGLEGDIYRETRRIAREHRDEIEARFPKILRRVSGYNLDAFTADEERVDLTQIVVGSEGTLCAVTEARVRLVPLPAHRAMAAVHFETIGQAAEATVVALEHHPSAVELIDDTIVRRCRDNPGYRQLASFVQGDPGALLLIEFYGDDEAQLTVKLRSLADGLRAGGLGYATVATTDAAEQQAMWGMRQAGLGLLMSVRGDTKPLAFVEDTAVAPERLPAFIERFDAIVRAHGTEAGYYGHASVGCLHIRPMVNITTDAGLREMEQIASEVADLVLEFGGSLSGEHGDGILRGVFTERMFGPRLTQAFRDLKRAWDPQGILNPGKIIDTPAFGENLRIGPATRNVEPTTHLDFSADGGFARAIEMCNGQGACRKMDGGMCPSYMVTQDEEHSTRGRANLLRMAISGVLPPEALTGERMLAALDLCVECKACKAECPSGVDMAKLKYEVLTKHHEQYGVPLRSRLFGHIATVSRLGSAAAPLANAVTRMRPVRWALHRFLGIHRERPLPHFARESFRRWFTRRLRARGTPLEAPRGEVVLFDDTFTQYEHPEVGQAATRVLEALGYRVVLVQRIGCCGRPLISKGMLGTAARWARRNVEALLPYAERGVPIVGTEPSCLLTLRDEYPDLLRDDASRTVAGQALLLDELIARLAGEQPDIASIFRDDVHADVLLHGHCHQKALAGMDSTLTALRLVPGYSVELIDAACCGMAGSFGFEAEHYEVSQAMGALRLFPAVEASAPATQVAVTGVSCRQQIDHFTTRRARHAVELLADALR